MGKCFSATTFLSAGNITHTPAYGHMIALGVLHAVGLRKASPEQVANAEAYRAEIAAHRPVPDLRRRRRDRSATGCATTRPIASRSRSSAAPMRASSCAARSACTPARPSPRTSISARSTAPTSTAIARPLSCRSNARGVTVICRKRAARDDNPCHLAAQQPLRRARRPDVARRRGRAVEPRVPHRPVARAGGALAVLAPALLLAVEGGVHPRPGARLCAGDGPQPSRADARLPARPDHRRADRARPARPRPSAIRS